MLNQVHTSDSLKFTKISSGNGIGKNMLDITAFPSEASLTWIDFLQAYTNWILVIKSTCNDTVARGWYTHYDQMIADPDFVKWFLEWFKWTKHSELNSHPHSQLFLMSTASCIFFQ